MDAPYISALAALAGAAIGGLTSFATSWITQHAEARTQHLAHMQTTRQDLYREFVEESSRLYADSLIHETLDVGQLIRLYAMVSRMRALSSDAIVQHADKVVRMIVDSYFEPNKTIIELHDMVNSGMLDPLREFTEACREEFRRAGYL
jgi:hypothetical protein